MNNQLMFASGNDATETPWGLFKQLDNLYHFGCDMAALASNRKVDSYFGPDHVDPTRRDCLVVDWPTSSPNWLNPPYSDGEMACKEQCTKKRCAKRGFHITEDVPGCYDFVEKAVEEMYKGATTVALLAARTDTQWWHEFIWHRGNGNFRHGVSVQFLRGRLKFEGHKDSAPFPSVLAEFSLRKPHIIQI